MAIGLGSRLGPSEVTALIGEGGMSKVWRAHHTELKRDWRFAKLWLLRELSGARRDDV